MSRDIFGRVNKCEVCGKMIRGSGISYCAKHRTEKQRMKHYSEQQGYLPPQKRPLSPYEQQMNKAMGFLFIGLLVILVIVGLLWVVATALSSIWNSGIIGKVVLLSPFILLGLFFSYKIWGSVKKIENENDQKKRVLILIITYFVIVIIIIAVYGISSWISTLHNKSLLSKELKEELSRTQEQKLTELQQNISACNKTFITTLYSRGQYDGIIHIIISPYLIFDNYSSASMWINNNSIGSRSDLIDKLNNATFPLAIFEGSATIRTNDAFSNYYTRKTISLICYRRGILTSSLSIKE